MKRRLVVVIVFLTIMMAITIPNVKASPDILWGVTGAREVFTVDTATGVVTILSSDPVNLFGDIAMTPNGNLYATGAADPDFLILAPNAQWAINFNDFHRLDPATGNVMTTWSNLFTDAGFHRCNALAAESSTSLLAIEGGAVCTSWGYPTGPRLLRITLDAAGNYVSITSLGPIAAAGASAFCCCSDGDLDRDPFSGKWYAGFWDTLGSEMLELNLANPSASVSISQSSITYEGGFAFDSVGIAYAGSWADENLYTVNVVGGGSSILYDLSSDLGGAIYGLSRQFAAPVGGEWVPVNLFQLLTPWIALGLIALGIAVAGIKRFAFRRP
jgi:hypothetical protein